MVESVYKVIELVGTSSHSWSESPAAIAGVMPKVWSIGELVGLLEERERRKSMPRVMIRCPKTDKPLPTGGAMDKKSFEGRSYTNYEVLCPHCGINHPVTKEDTWLEGDERSN